MMLPLSYLTAGSFKWFESLTIRPQNIPPVFVSSDDKVFLQKAFGSSMRAASTFNFSLNVLILEQGVLSWLAPLKTMVISKSPHSECRSWCFSTFQFMAGLMVSGLFLNILASFLSSDSDSFGFFQNLANFCVYIQLFELMISESSN